MFSKETCEMTIKILSTCYPLQFWEYSPAMELLSNHDGHAVFPTKNVPFIAIS